MNIGTQEKVEKLKVTLTGKVKEMIDYINDQYVDSSPVFLKEGETSEVDYALQNAKSIHLAVLRNTENRIFQFFTQVDETMEKVQFQNEKEWLKNVENEAAKLMEELNGLK
jgi:hypothetical protein